MPFSYNHSEVADALAAACDLSPVEVEVASWCAVVARHTGRDRVIIELVGDLAPLRQGRFEVDLAGDADLPTVARRLAGASPVVAAPMATFRRGAGPADHRGLSLHVGPVDTEARSSCADEPSLGEILVGQFVQTFCSAATSPETPVSGLVMAPPSEAQLHAEWNDTVRNYRLDTTYFSLVREQAARTPDRTAVITDGGSLTYRNLVTRADGIGDRLRAVGVGRDAIVGVLVDRGLEAMVALTGVLSADAASLSFDPRNPAKRLAHVIERSQATAIIVADRYRALLDDAIALAGLSPTILPLETATTDGVVGDIAPRHAPAPTDLAYAVTTSGTTGLPKVAMVEQRGLVNHCFGMIEILALSEHDVVAQTAPLSFDIAVWQHLTPLLTGATVAIAADDVAADPVSLLEFIERFGVTVLQLVPSLLRAVLEVAADRGLADLLRWVLPTGEALPVELARDWITRFPDRPLLNLYGPAECSDDNTSFLIDVAPSADATTIPIGRPLPNVTMHVLDDELRPVPLGVIGEICVGGVVVGRGYSNDPERTAAVFVDLPSDRPDQPVQRVYRTGDLGRFRADGLLEYAGRRDFQLKIRGFRVEAGEVEAALDSHPAVSASVVSGFGEGEARRLVAYVVPNGSMPSGEALRSHLAERLPAYMMPSTFMTLDRLPVTANGKVDRTALPVPVLAKTPGRTTNRPLTNTEQKVLRLWREVLHTEAVGPDDNFFDAGGSSIMAALLFWKLSRDLDVDLPLSTLMIAPTVRQLSERIDRRAELPPPVLVPLQPHGDKTPLFLFHAQGGETLGYRYLAAHLDPTRPVYGLDPTRVRGVTTPPTTMAAMVDRYLATIRERQPRGPYLLGGFCMGGAVAWATAQRLRNEGETVALVVLLQSDHGDYPVAQPGLSSKDVLRAKLRDRAAFEVRTLRAVPQGQRAQHLRVKVLGKIWAGFTLPIERRLEVLAAKRGRTYAGSERFDIDRWRKSDGGIYDGYEFTPYDGEVLQVRCDTQPTYAVPDPTLGWGPLLVGPHHLESVPGHHLDFLSLRAPAIAAIVDRHLGRVDS